MKSLNFKNQSSNRVVLLDLDGCLVDSRKATFEALSGALSDLNLEQAQKNLSDQLFGLTFTEICNRLSVPVAYWEQLRERKNFHFRKMVPEIEFRMELVKEINSSQFSDHILCMATHSSFFTLSLYSERILKQMGEFVFLCSDTFPYLKSNKMYYLKVAQLFCVKTFNIILFDDNQLNVQTAVQQGCMAKLI